ncbi:MAG: exodeoxyribonuclease VII large subunit [Treponema sp.]|nr:exodeoxyribonuclease VII large subunit [Treponema sp.]
MKGRQNYTVFEITSLIQAQLENAFPSVIVEGELSNCRPSSTGHLYFSLKDSRAKLDAVLFKGRVPFLAFQPKDGMLVRARGRISVYAQRGNYQLIADDLELAGAGDILAMLEERKRLLAAEGLFDETRKKQIPRFPETVGVVSSPTGAAVQDILNILKRRARGIRVILFPAPVQGADAAAIIAARIGQANQWDLADVLIVGRGGGSLEDLLPFSEEIVVRAIAESRIPVVSAVGHEIDNALSDLAADLRAPTPSAAAELVSDRRDETLARIRNLRADAAAVLRQRIDRARLLAKPFGAEDLEYRIRGILQPRLIRLDDAKEGLLTNLGAVTGELRRRLELARTGLEAGSPRAVLERGFSVVVNKKNGRVLRSADETLAGDGLAIRLLDGTVHAVTEKTEASAAGTGGGEYTP